MALWWKVGRAFGFWAITILVLAASSLLMPWIDLGLIAATIGKAFHGDIEPISHPEFAYALAGALFCFAMGLGIAFSLVHVVPIWRAMAAARRAVEQANGPGKTAVETRKAFAAGFTSLNQKLDKNWLIGHAWSEFEGSLVDTDSARAIGNTVRPQVFLNPGVARERLSGLKMMAAVPGYFVGIGLLLTFVGLVFALYKAGTAASAGDAKSMAGEMGQLLKIATFKFSTSIAGLLASIILSIAFRCFSIIIEGAFDGFNTELERGLRYYAPQSISLEIRRTMQDQLDQLKNITQGDFFARMGAEMAPRLHAAVSDAMAPVTEQIGSAVENLTTSSEGGVQQLLDKFSESLNYGAGTEMRELAATLRQLQMSMAEMQGGLRGTGEDFSVRLAEAADNLNRMVERAGHTFEQSSGQSRDALATVVETLRQTLERANGEVDAALGRAAGGASARLEAVMGVVMAKLDGQINQIGVTIDLMQQAMGAHGERTRRQIEASVSHAADVQKSAIGDLHAAAQDVAAQLRATVEEALASVGQRFNELSTSMRAIEGALTSQKVALEAASGEVRKTAQAFGESAHSVRAATGPLTAAATTFSGATEKLSSSVEATLAALAMAKDEMAALASGLNETNARSGAFWSSFATKFDDVDTALGRAVEVLSRSTMEQQDQLRKHVQEVDVGLTKAIGSLTPLLINMSESAEAIADSLQGAKT